MRLLYTLSKSPYGSNKCQLLLKLRFNQSVLDKYLKELAELKYVNIQIGHSLHLSFVKQMMPHAKRYTITITDKGRQALKQAIVTMQLPPFMVLLIDFKSL
jgi:hypothetical protein